MFSLVYMIMYFFSAVLTGAEIPMVINTWAFTEANRAAWNVLNEADASSLDAVEKGCSQAEADIANREVGWGGTPDENGETTLDALIFDGPSHKSGSVGCLRHIRPAISVARKVLEHTKVSLLVGSQATKFALRMGFKKQSMNSRYSRKMWIEWKKNHCQPNFWINVTPDPQKNCGPYEPRSSKNITTESYSGNDENHDTIGMVAIDSIGRMAVGTSTNGLKFKIPGRVGDSPIPGAGAYVDQTIGGAACTGDGDITMRFLPSYQAVQNLRNGFKPDEAARNALIPIAEKYPTTKAAIVVATISGQYGAACYGFENFPFSVRSKSMTNTAVYTAQCFKL